MSKSSSIVVPAGVEEADFLSTLSYFSPQIDYRTLSPRQLTTLLLEPYRILRNLGLIGLLTSAESGEAPIEIKSKESAHSLVVGPAGIVKICYGTKATGRVVMHERPTAAVIDGCITETLGGWQSLVVDWFNCVLAILREEIESNTRSGHMATLQEAFGKIDSLAIAFMVPAHTTISA